VLNGSKPIWRYGPDYCTRNREAQQQNFVADFYTWENDAERILITFSQIEILTNDLLH